MRGWCSRRVSLRCLCLAALLSACAGAPAAPARPRSPTLAPTPSAPAPTAILPTAVGPTPSLPTDPPPRPPAASPIPSPTPVTRPAYALTATLDLAAHTAEVTASVRLAPPEPGEVVFNFNALLFAGAVQGLEVRVDGQPASPGVERVWLRVPVPADAPVRPEFTFRYRLVLPETAPLAWGWRGTLGWTPRQVNLGEWFPVLAHHVPGAGWQTPPPAVLGEYYTTPAADFEVSLAIAGRSNGRTTGLVVAGSGQPFSCPAGYCFRLAGGRLPAYSVSPQLLTVSRATRAGVAVTSAYFPEQAAAGEAALAVAVQAVETYSALFGAYPFDTLTLVEGDFFDGMEYSGLSFVGQDYYRQFDGTAQNFLTLIAAHETAHQWWHTLVGNDPANEPWLDEALSTYSELLYLERHHPELADWWWAFRVAPYAPDGAVGQPVYAHLTFRAYVDATYLRGAQMLHAMRAAVGDEPFFSALRAYAGAQAGRVATGADFWQAYAAAGGDPAAIQAEFFNP